MIRHTRDEVRAAEKVRVTELTDSFGSRVVVQTPIVNGDHAQQVEAKEHEMRQHEQDVIAALKSEGFTDAQISLLMVQP